MLSSFSYTHQSFACHSWRNVNSNSSSIFLICCLVFVVKSKKFLIYSEYQFLTRCMISKYFHIDFFKCLLNSWLNFSPYPSPNFWGDMWTKGGRFLVCLTFCALLIALYIWVPHVGCTNIYKCYIFLLDCPVYYYIVPFFVSCYSHCFKM